MTRWVRQMQSQELARELASAEAFFLVDFRGLKANQAVELREALRERRARMRVVKNAVVRHALEELGRPVLRDRLKGMNALLWGEDPAVTVKTLLEFSQRNGGVVVVRAGELNGRPLSGEEVQQLARLPERRQLHARLVGVLSGAAGGKLACTLNALAGQFARLLAAMERTRRESS